VVASAPAALATLTADDDQAFGLADGERSLGRAKRWSGPAEARRVDIVFCGGLDQGAGQGRRLVFPNIELPS